MKECTDRSDVRMLRRSMRHLSDPIADAPLMAVLLRVLADGGDGDALAGEQSAAAQILLGIADRLELAIEIRRRECRARGERR